MAQVQMDIDQVRQFGNDLKGQYTEQLQSLKNTLKGKADGLNWQGSDAQQFKGDRTQQIVTAIDGLINKLGELGQTAIMNADKQQETSTAI